MESREHRVTSIADYVQQVSEITFNPDAFHAPPKLLFRGHSNKNYALVPSLARRPSSVWQNSWTMVEKELVERAQQKFPLIFSATDYPAILLAKLQHYGINTRMLDLTENALVALYFACKQHEDKDGEVLAFSAQPVSAYNPDINAIADTYRLTRNGLIPASAYYYKVQNQQYYSPYLYEPKTEESKQRILISFLNRIKKPFFVAVGSICERQKNQGGYFLLFPNTIISDSEDQSLDDIFDPETEEPREQKFKGDECIGDELARMSKDDCSVVRRFIIPKEAKKNMLVQLERFGITTDFLFADSVDEVCKGVVSECKKYFVE